MKQLILKTPILNGTIIFLYKSIRKFLGIYRLKKHIKNSPLRIVIGASGISDSEWIETEMEYLNLLNPNHWETYFQKNSIDAILAEHVWEHITIDEGLTAAKRCFEYLKPGGYVRVAVPDGFKPDKEYIRQVKPGGTGPEGPVHRVLYNHITLAELFETAGFQVHLLEYFDSNGDFQYTDWNPDEGKIHRSKRYHEKNKDGALNVSSIILDAYKNA